MDALSDFFHMITSKEGFNQIIEWGGYAALFAIIFSETGLLIGFFLPGDSLLFTAGLLSSNNRFGLDIFWLNVLLIPAAIIGDAVGYTIGRRSGDRLYNRPNSRFFKKEHIEKTQAFYARHGGKTIILARFVPIVRTFAPMIAGAAKMPYRQFATFNIVGGVLWIMSTTLLGYFLGRNEWVEENFEKVIFGIIFLSILPIIIELIRAGARKKKEQARVKMEAENVRKEGEETGVM